MAEYNERDAERAEKIIAGVFEGERRGGEFEEGLSIADIEDDTALFRAELNIVESTDSYFPALEIADGLVPVSLTSFFYDAGPPITRHLSLRTPFWDIYSDWMRYALRDRARIFGDEPTLSPGQARESFFDRARIFLATRLAGLRSRPSAGAPPGPPPTLNLPQFLGGPPTSTVAGCHFSVKTNSPGLAVYWSGAYFISANYLGSPTSPAVGVLQAGTYVFGINGGAYGNRVRWDKKKVCSLPGLPSVHLPY